MKKSSIKYFGVTAAALLAVAPMAAQTVSQGNSVDAAVTSSVNTQVTNAVNALPSTANATNSTLDKMKIALENTDGFDGYNSTFTANSDNTFLQAIRNANWNFSGTDAGNGVKYVVSQANGWSGQDTKNTILNNTSNNASYPVIFTVKAIDTTASNAVLATKNITVTFAGTSASSMNATFNPGVAKVGDYKSSLELGYQAVKDLNLVDGRGNKVNATGVSATVEASGSNGQATTDVNNKFNGAGKAVQTLTFDVPSAYDGTTYSVPTIHNTNTNADLTGGQLSNTDATKATTTRFTITRDINVYDGSVSTQPFFSVVSNGTWSTLPNNAIANLTNDTNNVSNGALIAGTSATTANVAAKFNNVIDFTYATSSSSNTTGDATATDIKNAVVAAGGSVDSNGNITNLTGINYLTVTLYSPINNKPATVKVPVNFSADSTSTNLPKFTGVDDATIIQGQNFNAYNNVKAYDNGYASAPEIMSGYWTVSNPVNTGVAGDYNVVYSVVNSQGLTTSVTRKVTVLPVNGLGKDQVVNFVPGYGVMVWSATDNAVNATSDFVQHGTTVKTFDTKTVDGVSYTRINKANSNQWVQSKYFDANANNAPQTNNNDNNTNTDSNKETPFESTLTINYVPGYRVFLRDGQANMQQQSVAHGESFKVWAKKTVGNHTYYRIGTDAQWIEDTYAQF